MGTHNNGTKYSEIKNKAVKLRDELLFVNDLAEKAWTKYQSASKKRNEMTHRLLENKDGGDAIAMVQESQQNQKEVNKLSSQEAGYSELRFDILAKFKEVITELEISSRKMGETKGDVFDFEPENIIFNGKWYDGMEDDIRNYIKDVNERHQLKDHKYVKINKNKTKAIAKYYSLMERIDACQSLENTYKKKLLQLKRKLENAEQKNKAKIEENIQQTEYNIRHNEERIEQAHNEFSKINNQIDIQSLIEKTKSKTPNTSKFLMNEYGLDSHLYIDSFDKHIKLIQFIESDPLKDIDSIFDIILGENENKKIKHSILNNDNTDFYDFYDKFLTNLQKDNRENKDPYLKTITQTLSGITKKALVIEKRYADNKKENSGSCFIATAAYGSPLAKEVVFLRDFRDTVLIKHLMGRRFVNVYYKKSPAIARSISKSNSLKKVTRVLLIKPLIRSIKYFWKKR